MSKIRERRGVGIVAGASLAVRRHALVVSIILVAVITGMWVTTAHAHLFTWIGGFASNGEWWTPVDFWQPIPGTHAILWGAFPHLYDYIGGGYLNGYYNPPGLVLLYLPFTALADKLGLVGPGLFASAPGVHPTAWLVYGPVEIATCYSVLFPIEALVKRGTDSAAIRRSVVVASALLLVFITLFFGHPEYMLALGCGIYGLGAGLDGKYRRMAWFFGAGLAFQPVAGLFMIPVLGVLKRREVLPVLWRIVLVPLLILVVPFVGSSRATWMALANQSAYPSVIAAEDTPFTNFVPHEWYEYGYEPMKVPAAVKNSPFAGLMNLISRPIDKQLGPSLTPAETKLPTTLNGGVYRIEHARGSESRVLAFMGAGLLAVLVARRRRRGRLDPSYVVWAAALGLALRPIFDVADFPYYEVPGLLALLVAASWRGRPAAAKAIPVALGVLALGFWPYVVIELGFPRLPVDLWWGLLVALTGALATLAWPRAERAITVETGTTESEAAGESNDLVLA